MGIPIGDKRRRRRRRSYADYKPRSRRQGPRDDPFRIVFYLVLIAGALWVYFNPDVVRGWIEGEIGELPLIASSGETAPQTDAEGTAAEAEDRPLSPEELAARAEEAYLSGNLDEAIDLYQQAADAAPNTVDYPFQVARLLLFKTAMQYGEAREATLEEALNAANMAILADPESPAGYAIMGKVMDWSERPEDASSQILRALEIDENYALGQSYLAEALVDLDRWDQAQQTIEKALALDPNSVDIRRDYAYILESLGDYAGAATQYEAALRIHPRLAFLHVALGRVYRVLGRYDEALDAFFEAETIEPENALIQFEVGLTYETFIGDPASATEFYERAVELDEEFAAPWVRLGTIRYLQGSYSQAAPALERALALGQDNDDIYYRLGLSYANMGQCENALPYLREAQNRFAEDEELLAVIVETIEVCTTPTPTAVPTQDTGN
ncbi:MAG TPA: tetratricopeptide repeat protein [Chloroflexi bacterium]|nr:tetratricopeptide repeat protein [Chloroflexota bacterium]